ncbi:hypothetical protein DH2020_001404 [Rehmannia glutinosa]|uniref:Uncharacterized protein n=1 Tax=Rehmannia glutinosa TaxID=99300 RepID=A0ABR0XZY5_REHGL
MLSASYALVRGIGWHVLHVSTDAFVRKPENLSCKDVMDSVMGFSKTEVNLRRLLAAAPQQQNQAKLVHYVATLREQLEQLAEERSPGGLPRVSKAQLNEYSEKIEAIAAKLVVTESSTQISEEPALETKVRESPSISEEESISSPRGLRRRLVPPSKDRPPNTFEDTDTTKSVKLDAAAQAHIEKHRSPYFWGYTRATLSAIFNIEHLIIISLFLGVVFIGDVPTTDYGYNVVFYRKLQEDLTDEMVDLARQLKESSLMMNQSIKNTENILDSTEKAVEHSLASTGHANSRAMDVYSQSLKTSCFTWLLVFAMTCIFIMVVLLIRVT